MTLYLKGSRDHITHIKATVGTQDRRLNLLSHCLDFYGLRELNNSIIPRRDCIVHWLILGFLPTDSLSVLSLLDFILFETKNVIYKWSSYIFIS